MPSRDLAVPDCAPDDVDDVFRRLVHSIPLYQARSMLAQVPMLNFFALSVFSCQAEVLDGHANHEPDLVYSAFDCSRGLCSPLREVLVCI